MDSEPGRVTVTLWDSEYGEFKTSGRDFNAFWWAEGNGCCDCNRVSEFFDTPDDWPCQAKRFLVVHVEGDLDGYTLDEFNGEYPEDLRRRAYKAYAETYAMPPTIDQR